LSLVCTIMISLLQIRYLNGSSVVDNINQATHVREYFGFPFLHGYYNIYSSVYIKCCPRRKILYKQTIRSVGVDTITMKGSDFAM
jgi:hypothetical protein